MTPPMIELKNVTAAYGRAAQPALKAVSLAVQPGEIFGLLGPNGAGKSTLLACVEGLHRPSTGTVTVGGFDVQRQPAAAKRLLGIQLQKTALLDDLTVGELVEVYAALYEVHLTPAQTAQFLARFDLTEHRRKLARRLSGGQQQRLALALAVTNDPRIVLLDEPTSALDPHARRSVWDQIRQMHDEGRAVVLTTHAMEEAEALCGRVAIIDQGRIVACDTPAQLVAGLKANPVLKATIDMPLAQAQALPGVQLIATRRHVAAGEAFIQPEIASRALRELMHPTTAAIEPLSDRAREVLVLLALGRANREIAEKLVITEGTVKNHVSNILAKLQAANRTQAADIARRRGLL